MGFKTNNYRHIRFVYRERSWFPTLKCLEIFFLKFFCCGFPRIILKIIPPPWCPPQKRSYSICWMLPKNSNINGVTLKGPQLPYSNKIFRSSGTSVKIHIFHQTLTLGWAQKSLEGLFSKKQRQLQNMDYFRGSCTQSS